jgi:3-oxoacyl-[acyl-carrier protein] reductase
VPERHAQPLAGRAAVITGVSRRNSIGFAIARRLLSLGAGVFIQSWTPHDAAQEWGADPVGMDGVIAELTAEGGRVAHAEADFADPAAPARVIDAAGAAFGHVDILVVNHARSGLGALDQLTADDIDSFLHENVRAALLLAREFSVQHDGRAGGRVVLMTSGQHLGGMSREVAYAVSKGALHQATATLSEALIERGITVNTINPGPTDTGWGLADIDPIEEMPLGRWGEPDDAARLIAWLCTDDARWVTGQIINSEGGFRR